MFKGLNLIKISLYLIIFILLIAGADIWCIKFLQKGKNRAEIPTPDNIIAPYYRPEVFKNQLPPSGKMSAKPDFSGQAEVKIPILMYHYVEENMPKDSLIRKKLTINPVIFEKQLLTLKQAGYNFYFVGEIPDLIGSKAGADKNIVVLTFDDGYKDFYTVAFPLLKKYQVRATVFVINNAIGGRVYLNAGQIKELAASGLVEIGSHTLDHVALKERSKLEQRRQIEESKSNLEKYFNIKINSFAYPYGSFSPDTVAIVKGAGFSCAVSVIAGKEQSENNLYYLSRLRPGDRVGKKLLDFVER